MGDDGVTDGLFDGPERVMPPGLSRRRTRKHGFLIEIGLHPLTGKVGKSLKLAAGSRTCGDCVFCQPLDRDVPLSLTVYKCWYGTGERVTRGGATTIRKWWPACTDVEEKTDGEGTDTG